MPGSFAQVAEGRCGSQYLSSRSSNRDSSASSPFAVLRLAEVRRLAVIATLSKGYDLDYIWKQVDHGQAVHAASYYIQASETGGEPPGRWWGPGAQSARLRARPGGRARAVRPTFR